MSELRDFLVIWSSGKGAAPTPAAVAVATDDPLDDPMWKVPLQTLDDLLALTQSTRCPIILHTAHPLCADTGLPLLEIVDAHRE